MRYAPACSLREDEHAGSDADVAVERSRSAIFERTADATGRSTSADSSLNGAYNDKGGDDSGFRDDVNGAFQRYFRSRRTLLKNKFKPSSCGENR